MPRKIIDTSKINQTRLQYINKGYLTCSEVAKFVPCGSTKASRIYHQIRNQIEAEGLENCFNVILVNRLLDFMGLTAKEIKEAAKNDGKNIYVFSCFFIFSLISGRMQFLFRK